jgi:glycosyltransferase involved in cell wall biosynthesis
MSTKIGFFMDQIAGHVTNYRNMREVAQHEAGFQAAWHEIHYYRADGALEQIRRRMPFIPSYVTGVMRGTIEMHRALQQQQYDAIFTNASVRVFFTGHFRRVPTLVDLDATPAQIDRMAAYSAGWSDPQPIAFLKWKLFQRVLRSAALVQAWSRWAKQSVVDEYGIPSEKVVVNPPGVKLNFWRPDRTGQNRLGGAPRVLFVGGDFRRKGGQMLLDWFGSADRPSCELHIVTREEVPASPGIYVYNDMTPNSERLLRLFQSSDLFVLPSLGECFGIATVEAMATGLPVIASDVGGTADIIEPGRNGWIVPGADGRALKQAIESILSDAGRREAMGAQSRSMAEERFDVARNARRTFSYLQELGRGKPGGNSLLAHN